MAFYAEMPDMCDGKRSAPHKTVAGQPRPTGLDRQASNALAKVDLYAGHVGAEGGKVVWLFPLDLDAGQTAVGVCGKLGKYHQEPFDGARANFVIRCL